MILKFLYWINKWVKLIDLKQYIKTWYKYLFHIELLLFLFSFKNSTMRFFYFNIFADALTSVWGEVENGRINLCS